MGLLVAGKEAPHSIVISGEEGKSIHRGFSLYLRVGRSGDPEPLCPCRRGSNPPAPERNVRAGSRRHRRLAGAEAWRAADLVGAGGPSGPANSLAPFDV